MNEYQYKLEPYNGCKTRYFCPICNQKEFSRYIDCVNGLHINPNVGRCNRENNCGYHYPPNQYFRDNKISFENSKNEPSKINFTSIVKNDLISFISFDILRNSLLNYESNYFVMFLIELFGVDVTKELIEKYFIGTSTHWQGSTVFWQMDILGKIRTGKVMLYSSITGKRIKEPYNHIQWVHRMINQAEFNLNQCLFGEHLLNNNSKTVIIVESEKTAIISSVFMPDYIWLASGGLNNVNINILRVLEGRNVIFYPDIGAFELWKKKVTNLEKIGNFKVSNLLENIGYTYGLKIGDDIADYFGQLNK